MKTPHTVDTISRRTALVGIGAGGLGLVLADRNLGVSAQEATPDSGEADIIRDTERERVDALVDADMDVAGPLHTDDFEHINPVGVVLSKEMLLGAIAAGELDFLAFDLDPEIDVRLYGEAAAIRYRAQLEVVTDGQSLPRRGHWFTVVYELGEGGWQAAWSQATFAE